MPSPKCVSEVNQIITPPVFYFYYTTFSPHVKPLTKSDKHGIIVFYMTGKTIKHPYKKLYGYLRKNKITYSQYLQSEHWKDVRARFWKSKLHHYQCYICGSTENLQVHHKTYNRIGKEYLNDLCLLCENCHKKTHELLKQHPTYVLWGAARRIKKQRIRKAQADTK